MQPNEQQAAIHLARAKRFYRENEIAQAVEQLKEAVSHDTRNPHVWKMLAKIYGAAGQHEPAACYAQKALRDDPMDVESWVILTNIYCQLGGPFLDLALEQVNMALELNEDNADLYYLRGNAYAQLKNAELARPALNKALELNPKHLYAKNDLNSLG